MAVLGLRFCARAFSSCGKWGPLFIAVCGPLTIAASLVAEHRLQTRKLSNCGSWAQLLRGMWDFPRPGLEPVSPALAGRFSTTAPPGKPLLFLKKYLFIYLAAPGLSCGIQDLQLWHAGSIVAACTIQFPDQGSNPGPLHWECRVLPTGPPGKSLTVSVNQEFRYGLAGWFRFRVSAEVSVHLLASTLVM